MGKECEQVQIQALVERLGVQVCIEYLDGDNFTDHLNCVRIPAEAPSNTPRIHLLYRPGHYDILYQK